jgi:hypothetical protein
MGRSRASQRGYRNDGGDTEARDRKQELVEQRRRERMARAFAEDFEAFYAEEESLIPVGVLPKTA